MTFSIVKTHKWTQYDISIQEEFEDLKRVIGIRKSKKNK